MRTSAKLYTTLSLLAGIVIGALGWHFASPHLTKLARESVGEHESNAAGTNDAKRDGNGHTRDKLDSEPGPARVRLSPSAMRMVSPETAVFTAFSSSATVVTEVVAPVAAGRGWQWVVLTWGETAVGAGGWVNTTNGIQLKRRKAKITRGV